ncbi:cytochrome c oxidase assembly factor CtaG [Bacillus solitudinis]|uniref:cytochrome c oxidase assembly factor CtaG n=1 Tax=Bacillus solitudinis TaxID=2014074 RepID=UPI000C24D7CA|nr:cytochrome c oxidase assembly factor CtaG [Bacillus solitudinis]
MESLFSSFGFRTLWTPELIVPLVLIGVLYFYVITKLRKSFSGSQPVKLRQKVYFLLGLFALYLGWGSPLYVAGHLMITFHMTQMVFSYIVATPLLLLGIPKWVYEAGIRRFHSPFSARITKIVWNPIMALFLFNGLFSVYHVPFVFDTLMQSAVLHSLYQYFLFVTSIMMWWFMLAPIPNKVQLSDLRRIGYIFANGILITPACALIIFAGQPLYETYTNPSVWATVMSFCLPAGATVPLSLFNGPDSFIFLETRMDQQLAGVLMKIMQELAYGFTIGYVFKQWLSKEKQQDGVLTISDIPTMK